MPFLILFFFYVLQLETSSSALLNFVGRENEGLWFPLVVFGSMTIGSAFALVKREQDHWLNYAFHILALPLFIFFASLRFFPEAHIGTAMLPFIAIGLIMAAIYCRYPLWDLIVSFAIAGIIFYSLLFFGAHLLAKYQLLILTLNLLAIGFMQMKAKSDRVTAVAIAVALGALHFFGYFDTPSRLHQVLANYKEVRQLAESRMTGLFRTDLLYLEKKDLLVLQANGTRFAVLPSKVRTEEKLKGKTFSPTHDSPYVIMKPENVLVIGPAEGSNVTSALSHGIKNIWAVDINPNMFHFSLNEARMYTGGFYDRPEVKMIVDEGRHFLETTNQKFDLITLQGVQTGSQSTLESTAQIESYLFTEEAIQKMWDRLNDDGMIYFEEYRDFFYRSTTTESLLSVLGRVSLRSLPVTEKNVRLISFDQSGKNPNSRETYRRRREALFISKKPISEQKVSELIRKIGPEAKIEYLDNSETGLRISDDRPMFIVASFFDSMWTFLIVIFATLLAIPLILARKEYRRESGELLLLGAIYMLFVIAASGPASLLLGHPGYVAPVLYGSLLGGSLVGAWIALKSERSVFWIQLLLIVFLAGYTLSFASLKSQLIGVDSKALRFLAVFVIGFFFGMLVEVPYIRLLKQVDGWQRAFRFVVENAGTILAVPIGLWIQAQWGVSATLKMGVALAVALAFLSYKSFRKGSA